MANDLPSRAAPRASSPASTRELATRLHSTAIRLLRLLRRNDAATGLSPARASALSVLVFGGPLSLGELAAAEQVAAPTMSRLATGLERDGLVRRVADETDRRVVRLEATPAGRRILEAGRDRRVADLELRLARRPAEELAVLEEAVGLLETIVAERA